MRDLKVSGVDGADLHLVDHDGERYRLSVDDRVRESVAAATADVPVTEAEPSPGSEPRVEDAEAEAGIGAGSDAPAITVAPEAVAAPTPIGDVPHLPPGELVTPRAVQELLRAGHSVEQVATAAGWDLAKVERYAAPIEAERSYIAGLAQDLPVGATTTDTATTVGDRVAARLHHRGVAGDTVAWDAHRTAGRGWVVVCRFSAGGRTREASWLFRAATRTLTAVDDEARWLGEDERAAGGPIPAPAAPVKVFDVEAEGGVTEPGESTGSTGSGTATGSAGSSGPVDLVSAMQARSRGRRSRGARNRPGRIPLDVPTDPSPTSPGAGGPSRPVDGDHLRTQPVPVQQPGQTGHEADRAAPDDAPAVPTVDDLGHDPVTGTVDLFGAVALRPDDAGSHPTSDVATSHGVAPVVDEGQGVEDPMDAHDVPNSPDASGAPADPGDLANREDDKDVEDLGVGESVATDETVGSADSVAPASGPADADPLQAPTPADATADNQTGEPVADPPRDEAPSPAPPRRPSGARSGRPSVPSWDDIMFGGRRGRD